MKLLPSFYRAALIGLASLYFASAQAHDWSVQKEGSSLRFTGASQGDSFEGRFNEFVSKISFDPIALRGSKFDVTIMLASADTQNEERDDALHGSDFFAIAQHPKAQFIATEFVAAAEGFEARGTLALRGASQPVTLKFHWTPTANGVRLEGKATLNRIAFGIGAAGDWEDAEMIDHEVKVATTLILTPAAPL